MTCFAISKTAISWALRLQHQLTAIWEENAVDDAFSLWDSALECFSRPGSECLAKIQCLFPLGGNTIIRNSVSLLQPYLFTGAVSLFSIPSFFPVYTIPRISLPSLFLRSTLPALFFTFFVFYSFPCLLFTIYVSCAPTLLSDCLHFDVKKCLLDYKPYLIF